MAPKTVQEIMGHANLGITMDLYTHVTMDWKHEEMKKMTGILGRPNKRLFLWGMRPVDVKKVHKTTM